MIIKEYNDEYSRAVFDRMQELLDDFIRERFPSYHLHALGVHRDDMTEEVELRLHLRPGTSRKLLP